MAQEEWKSMVEELEVKKRAPTLETHLASRVTDMIESPDPSLQKRWFGKFRNCQWLKKLNTVEVGTDSSSFQY